MIWTYILLDLKGAIPGNINPLPAIDELIQQHLIQAIIQRLVNREHQSRKRLFFTLFDTQTLNLISDVVVLKLFEGFVRDCMVLLRVGNLSDAMDPEFAGGWLIDIDQLVEKLFSVMIEDKMRNLQQPGVDKLDIGVDGLEFKYWFLLLLNNNWFDSTI